MPFGRHPTNGQSQSHSSGLRRDEWLEYVGYFSRINSRTRVFYCERDCVAALMPGSHSQDSASIFDRVHRLDGVVHQIKNDILHLTAMTDDERQLGRKIDACRDAAFFQLSPKNVECSESDFVQINGLLLMNI
jgi:hypothetical protein